MKNLLKIIVLLFLVNTVNAQIVNIPDANFKAKLLAANSSNFIAYVGNVATSIDTNSNGQIEVSEALVITKLYLIGGAQTINSIVDFTGIETFVNLTDLDCRSNVISNMDLSALVNLKYLNCSNNTLTTINFTGLQNLTYLDCSNMILGTLNLTTLVNLKELYCYYDHLTSLNINGLTSLEKIRCFNNQLTSLNVAPLINLKEIVCSSNQLTILNIDNLSQLNFLTCSNNLISSLNLTNQVNMTDLFCDNNPISLLNLNPLINLLNLYCDNTNVINLDVTNCLNLTTLNCGSNVLTSLYIKNGKNENLNLINSPTLAFICADDTQVSSIQLQLNNVGNSTTVVNSYCSFNPGGNYNTITGSMLFDANNNGCDASDLPQPNIKIDINDGTNQGATFTNNTGNYKFYTQAGSFDLTPNVENVSFFTFSPTTATVSFSNNLNNTSTQNFCIAANGVHPDVEVALMPTSPARPGFDAPYKIVFKNKGNQMVSGTINLAFNDDKTDFVSSTPSVDTQSINSLTWNYINLMPFESRSITLTLNINSPVETPAVNIGDILNFVTTINPVTDDIPADNTFNYNQTVVGSFDPNSIECLEGESVDPSYIGQYLHYGVNFENTGNYPAENIVVKVIIDTTKYDMNSLQLMDTSHNSYTRITGNVAEFIFETINLDSGGHGNILFKIKTLNELSSGDMVNKRADIFFDYNAPIDTGMANTTFQTLSNGNFEIDDSISVYPNPTKSNININCQNTIKSIQLYDVQGRLLETKLVDDLQTSIDISEKTKGIYFLKITSDNGSKVVKVVKE